MIRRNHLAARQIRNRPRQLQHPVIRPGRQMQLLHSSLEQLLTRRVRLAELPHFGWAHLRIAGHLRPLEAFQLPFSRCLHPCSDRFCMLDFALIGQLLVIDAGNFDVDVDAIYGRAGESPL